MDDICKILYIVTKPNLTLNLRNKSNINIYVSIYKLICVGMGG